MGTSRATRSLPHRITISCPSATRRSSWERLVFASWTPASAKMAIYDSVLDLA